MSKLYDILKVLQEVAARPGQAVKKAQEKTGKKAVGLVPYYCPEEIVYAAGLLPIGVWGGQTDISLANSYFAPFTCSMIKATMELAIKGAYDSLEAMIIPNNCDTLKCFGQNFKAAIKGIKYIPIVHPQNRKITAGITFLQKEHEKVKLALEEIAGYRISDDNLNKSIQIYNDYRQTMRSFTKIAAKYPDIITPRVRHSIIKSAYFMEKPYYTDLVKELIAQISMQPEKPWSGKKVVITGIMAEPDSLLEIFEELKLAVTADDLAHESRQFRVDVPDGDNPMERLARRWSIMEGCSLIYDPDRYRNKMLLDLVRDNQADGLVALMMKFCDPEEFDYPLYKKEFDANNIPVLNLEIEQQMQVESIRTRLQSFSEMLGN